VTTIEGVDLPVYEIAGLTQSLYPHQLRTLRDWDSLTVVLLTAPTASGKTAAAFLPALIKGESVIAAYPTNALLRDQAEALASLAMLAGKSARIISPEEGLLPNGEDVQIMPIDGPGLEHWRQAIGRKYKGEVLDTLLTVSAVPKVVVTNPDVLYLLAAMQYRESQSGVSRLAGYSTLIVDEFHLYSGVELARLLYLIFLLQTFGGKVGGGLRRCILLSATPPAEVVTLLTEVFAGLQEITPESTPSPEACLVGKRTIMHPIRFHVGLPISSGQADILRRTTGFLGSQRRALQDSRAALAPRSLPMLVFFNSVVAARRLEHLLLTDGWSTDEVGAVRGLMNQVGRAWQGKTVVIGTSAAEVGIDFDARQLVFEAEEGSAFIQRLSRAGRHAPAEVYLLDPPASGATRLRSELAARPDTISRADFSRIVDAVFPSMARYAEFCSNQYGIFAAASLTQHVLDRVASDWGAGAAIRDRVQTTLLQSEAQYFTQWQSRRLPGASDVERLHSQTRRYMRLAKEGKTAAYGWMSEYASHFPSFRSQVPQVEVLDSEEQSLGRDPRYRADLRTLAIWARLGVEPPTDSQGLAVQVAGFVTVPQRYCVVLRRPHGWDKEWPPEGLFWVSPHEDGNGRCVAARLIADSTGGAFPGSFPPGDEPMLALIGTRAQLGAGGLDWRLQAWPLRGQAGTADSAQSKLLLLGDGCLLVRGLIG